MNLYQSQWHIYVYMYTYSHLYMYLKQWHLYRQKNMFVSSTDNVSGLMSPFQEFHSFPQVPDSQFGNYRLHIDCLAFIGAKKKMFFFFCCLNG